MYSETNHPEACSSSSSESCHPSLDNLKKNARLHAEKDHADKGTLRRARHHKPTIAKVKTRRQESNIRSAKICRAQTGFYIDLLEQELVLEECKFRQLMADQMRLTENTINLHNRIQQIKSRERELLIAERRRKDKEIKGSKWAALVTFGYPPSEMTEDLEQENYTECCLDREMSLSDDVGLYRVDPLSDVQLDVESDMERPAAQVVRMEQSDVLEQTPSTPVTTTPPKMGDELFSPVSLLEMEPASPIPFDDLASLC